MIGAVLVVVIIAIISITNGIDQERKSKSVHYYQAVTNLADRTHAINLDALESGFMAGYVCRALGADANDFHNLRVAIRSNRLDIVNGWMIYKSNELAKAAR